MSFLLPGTPPTQDIIPAAAVSSATRMSLANPFSTTLATAVDTGLEAAVEANDVCLINVFMTIDAPAGGSKFAIACPAGTIIEGWIESTQASLSTILRSRVTAIDTLTASMAATIRGCAVFSLRIVVGSVGGTVKVQACSTTATQTTLVDVGSTLEVFPGATEA